MRGGKRKGAGRKRGYKAIQAEKAREFLIAEVVKDIQPIIQAQKQAAMGIYVERSVGGTATIVYRKEPELKAGEYLLNQVAGKPKETMEVEGNVGLKIDV